MTGLALEGGGARGAYHMGVVKAYLENGFEFDGFTGTSIGSVNAAILAQGDFDRALELWPKLSMEQLFDEDEGNLIKIGEAKWDMRIVTNVSGSLRKIIEGGGVDTSKIKAIFSEYIDEQRLRSSGKDFGLVTVSLSERKPYEMFIEDIPQGELLQYIMASACFPGFKSEVIDGNAFIDGGLYNNCPVNMLIRKGYDEVVAVRTKAPGIYRKVKIPNGVNMTLIAPEEDLGNVMLFSPDSAEKAIRLGYFDGLRALRGLKGRSYYVDPEDENEILPRLMALPDRAVLNAGKMLGVSGMPVKRMLFEHVIPRLGTYLKLEKDFDYTDFIIALLEYAAVGHKIERYKVYGFRAFVSMVGDADVGTTEKKVSFRGMISPVKYDAAARMILRGLLRGEGNGPVT